jgi:hypothetical protein
MDSLLGYFDRLKGEIEHVTAAGITLGNYSLGKAPVD